MIIYLNTQQFSYQFEKLCHLFFPHEKIRFSAVPTAEDFECEESKILIDIDETIRIEAKLFGKNYIEEEKAGFLNSEIEYQAMVLLHNILSAATGIKPKWGILTGVRPVKLLRAYEEGFGEKEAQEKFRREFLVSDEKMALAKRTLKPESDIINLSKPNSYSLYVSIPFCPSRCSYCSFVSQSIESAQKYVPEYVEYLCKELEETAKIANELNLNLESIYIGGGTPTTLTSSQLDTLLHCITKNFDTENVREFTVEAGRADTIDEQKLRIIKKYNVDRISVNPQTFNNEVLKNIGRAHTAEESMDAFLLAKSMDFKNINMDLIAGLPGDSIESFKNTISATLDLNPQSITIHTLSMKRASNLVTAGSPIYNAQGEAVAKMLEYAGEKLSSAGYAPYYLYRQSKTVGNLENVGWSKPGFEGYYNVYIMDETHTILACGAGAATKIKEANGSRIERIFNFKFPYEYNTQFSQIIERKRQVLKVYEEFC